MSYSLQFEDTTIGYRRRGVGVTAVVEDVTLAVEQGQTLALVGQSGSGKSTLAAAAVGLLASNGQILDGDIRLDGESVLGKREKDWRRLRGELLGYIPQDPLSSLDPVQRIGSRLVSDIRLHRRVGKVEAAEIAERLLERVGVHDSQSKLGSYPHELSGGQLQRILIALALSGNPRLLIADEPTSALDVTVQRTILELLDELKEELGLSVLLITHDLALAADHSDDLAVINQGRIVDYGPVEALLEAPESDYTKQLFEDVPALSPDRYQGFEQAFAVAVSENADAELTRLTRSPAIEVHSLHKTFSGSASPVLRDVDLVARAGEIHALVGESGSGKTTMARIVAGLTSFESGTVHVAGDTVESEPALTNPRARKLQMVYQNPLAALDPRFTVQRLVEEPLAVHQELTAKQRRGRALEVLDQVALSEELIRRRPAELSGGQRQRVAIARALVNAPDVLVLDEPTSALDVTVQRQIVDLLVDLQKERGLTYLFISHDLSLVRQIADRVTVLEQGRVVESGSATQLFGSPKHAYTQKLIESIPGQRARSLVAV